MLWENIIGMVYVNHVIYTFYRCANKYDSFLWNCLISDFPGNKVLRESRILSDHFFWVNNVFTLLAFHGNKLDFNGNT